MNGNIFYNAHHSPVGAFASFTLGYKGASGGIGTELAGPACQNVYIGLEMAARGQFKALPFYKYDDDRRSNDTSAIPDGGAGQSKGGTVTPFDDGVITREITPCTDTWRAGELEFKIYTPHLPVPDPSKEKFYEENLKRAVIPAVFVELTVDNTGNDYARRVFFGYEGNDPYSAMRLHDDRFYKITGVGQGRVTGIFTDCKDAVCATAFSVNELLADDITIIDKFPFRLGTAGLMFMVVEANEKCTWRFAVCFYRDGIATSDGEESIYLYTHSFRNIERVAEYGLKNFDFYKQAALERDKELLSSQLSDERRFMLSMAIKSYYGSTQLLAGYVKHAEEGWNWKFWVVVEGGYRMINTLDLAVDHLFFEMRTNPWAVRSILEVYAGYYWYRDEVKNNAGEKFPGGLSFTHDMGVGNVFSPWGQSAYELSNLKGCYSYMTHEQLVNWVICAGVYWIGTGDDNWLCGCKDDDCDDEDNEDYEDEEDYDEDDDEDNRGKKITKRIAECLTSMVNRDGATAAGRDGVMDLDSCETGYYGAEITTYDNVDTALGQARRNSYLAVKCWAAYLLLEKMFDKLALTDEAELASAQAEKCAATVLKYVRADGTIPAILEEGNEATTLSVVEGLIYTYITGMFDDPAFINKYGAFIATLKKHFEAALTSGCKFPDGSWKMSKTSDNSWLSKTYLLQFIAEKIFNLPPDIQADAIHASWLLDPDNAFYAFSDQMKAGKMCGSPYYPRGVTAALWV